MAEKRLTPQEIATRVKEKLAKAREAGDVNERGSAFMPPEAKQKTEPPPALRSRNDSEGIITAETARPPDTTSGMPFLSSPPPDFKVHVELPPWLKRDTPAADGEPVVEPKHEESLKEKQVGFTDEELQMAAGIFMREVNNRYQFLDPDLKAVVVLWNDDTVLVVLGSPEQLETELSRLELDKDKINKILSTEGDEQERFRSKVRKLLIAEMKSSRSEEILEVVQDNAGLLMDQVFVTSMAEILNERVNDLERRTEKGDMGEVLKVLGDLKDIASRLRLLSKPFFERLYGVAFDLALLAVNEDKLHRLIAGAIVIIEKYNDLRGEKKIQYLDDTNEAAIKKGLAVGSLLAKMRNDGKTGSLPNSGELASYATGTSVYSQIRNVIGPRDVLGLLDDAHRESLIKAGDFSTVTVIGRLMEALDKSKGIIETMRKTAGNTYEIKVDVDG